MHPAKLNSKQIKAISKSFYEKQHAKTLFELIAKNGAQSRYDLVGDSKSINVSLEISARVNPRLAPFGFVVHSVKNPGDKRPMFTLFKSEEVSL